MTCAQNPWLAYDQRSDVLLGVIVLVVNLVTHLLGERRITDLLVGHAVYLARMLGCLRDDLVVIVRHDHALTIETQIAAMKLPGHVAPLLRMWMIG